MALNVCNTGENFFLSKLNDQDLHLHLYVDDITPADGDTPASYTECADSGYALEVLADSGWTNGVYGTEIEFTLEDAATIYGYYVTNTANDTLIWSEKLSTPLGFGASGGSVLITPSISAT